MDGGDGMFIVFEADADEEPKDVSLFIIGGPRRVSCARNTCLMARPVQIS